MTLICIIFHLNFFENEKTDLSRNPDRILQKGRSAAGAVVRLHIDRGKPGILPLRRHIPELPRGAGIHNAAIRRCANFHRGAVGNERDCKGRSSNPVCAQRLFRKGVLSGRLSNNRSLSATMKNYFERQSRRAKAYAIAVLILLAIGAILDAIGIKP